MAQSIVQAFQTVAQRLMELGLGYLTLDRGVATLSTGERQRMQLARAVRNRTTGVLYVLDEPSIGLHPANLVGLTRVMEDLVADGNSVLLVDHDTQVLAQADWLIELGPRAGAARGQVIAQGTVEDLGRNPASQIGPFLTGQARVQVRHVCGGGGPLCQGGGSTCPPGAIHTVKPLEVDLPKGRLTVVTGVSGSGKTTPDPGEPPPRPGSGRGGEPPARPCKGGGGRRHHPGQTHRRHPHRPERPLHRGHLRQRPRRAAEGLCPNPRRPKHWGTRRGTFPTTPAASAAPTCDGTGSVSLDVQFLPDVDIPCPTCRGSRYDKKAHQVAYTAKDGGRPTPSRDHGHGHPGGPGGLPGLEAHPPAAPGPGGPGAGVPHLGEATPSLSGGEAQRLKLASEMGRGQADTLFVFDEPTIGLHPLDVATLFWGVPDPAGPGGHGGGHRARPGRDPQCRLPHRPGPRRRPGWGTHRGPSRHPAQVAACPESVTGRYL